MPRPRRDALRELLRELPSVPTAVQIDAVVAALTADATTAAHPLMSLGATLRHRASHLSEALRDQLRHAAQAALLERRTSAPAPLPIAPAPGEWLTVREAALALGITEATLLERLRHPEQRQRLGWPMWDGHRWWIAAAAVAPARRAAFLAAQPRREPLPELLPPSCMRSADRTEVSQSDASAAPSTAPDEVPDGPTQDAA